MIMVPDFRPDKRLALGLMPTDSTNMPKDVFLTNTITATTTTSVMMMGNGIPRMLPLPINLNGEYCVVNCLPLVMICAMPRPPTIKIRVAMMGCILSLAMSEPLNSPIRAQTISGTAMA